MNDTDSNRDDLLLLNKKDLEDSNIQNNKSSEFEEFDKYVKASSPKELDIQSLIQKFNELPCCLNKFLEKIMKTPKGLFLLLEIRTRDIKIKIRTDNRFDDIIICQWCMKNCCKYTNFLEKEITIDETNSKICSCDVENHNDNYYIIQKNYNLNSDEQKEIDKITDFCKDYTIIERKKIFKEKIMNLIKGKDNEKILKIICNMLNINVINAIIYDFDYNDDIHFKILSCLKENTDYSNYNCIMSYYFSHYFTNIRYKENAIYVFKEVIEQIPALYYYNPNILAQSFFLQVYRKKIISKNIESNDCISFLRKLGINNEILCSHMVNTYLGNIELFLYGFFTLDSILKLNEKELTIFKQKLSCNFIFIFLNQICEIFSDFMYNGYTKHISLMDKSNHFSKILMEYAIDRISSLNIDFSKTFCGFSNLVKKDLIIYPLFKFIFYEENKQRIITLLSSYSFSFSQKNEIFKDSEDFSEIFNLIE